MVTKVFWVFEVLGGCEEVASYKVLVLTIW